MVIIAGLLTSPSAPAASLAVRIKDEDECGLSDDMMSASLFAGGSRDMATGLCGTARIKDHMASIMVVHET